MISIVVLAAGLSTRFVGNKLLACIHDMTVIRRVVTIALKSKANEVVVVTGNDADKIKEELNGLNCKFVHNKKFIDGQSSSVKVGVDYVRYRSEAVLILPADVALITRESIDKVIDEYMSERNRIVVATYKGTGGHPILFDQTLYDEIMKIDEKTSGLKAVINRNRHFVKRVEIDSEEVLLDFDTVEDFKKHVPNWSG